MNRNIFKSPFQYANMLVDAADNDMALALAMLDDAKAQYNLGDKYVADVAKQIAWHEHTE